MIRAFLRAITGWGILSVFSFFFSGNDSCAYHDITISYSHACGFSKGRIRVPLEMLPNILDRNPPTVAYFPPLEQDFDLF